MNKPKIKLNLKCVRCQEEIILGEGTLIEKQPQHFSCYKKHIEDNLKKEVGKNINLIEVELIKRKNIKINEAIMSKEEQDAFNNAIEVGLDQIDELKSRLGLK